MYNWIWLGVSIGLDEIVYYMFDKDKHVLNRNLTNDEINGINRIDASCDYGQMNATVFEFWGLNLVQQKAFGLDEFYHSGRESGKQLTPSEYAFKFKKACEKSKKNLVSIHKVFILIQVQEDLLKKSKELVLSLK